MADFTQSIPSPVENLDQLADLLSFWNDEVCKKEKRGKSEIYSVVLATEGDTAGRNVVWYKDTDTEPRPPAKLVALPITLSDEERRKKIIEFEDANNLELRSSAIVLLGGEKIWVVLFDPAPVTRDSRTQAPKFLFISYRRQDSADITGRIYDRLVLRFGKKAVFMDVDSIPFGIDFRVHIREQLGLCCAVIVIIGNNWFIADEKGQPRLNDPRDHLRIEVETALTRNIPVIPVLVQGATIPHEEKLPSSLSSLSYRSGTPVRPDPDFHHDLDRLIKGVELHLRA